MSIDKFGAFIHPHYSRNVVKNEGELVASTKLDEVDLVINLIGGDSGTHTEFIYTGKPGKIMSISSSIRGEMISLNNGPIETFSSMTSKIIAQNDILKVYHVKKEKGEYTLQVADIIVKKVSPGYGSSQINTYTLEKVKGYRRVFKYPLQAGKVIKADVSPSTIILNGNPLDTLTNVELKVGDVIEFMPDLLFFEANLVVRCPIKQSV